MSDAARIEEQAADWLARRDGEGWSEEQQREMDAWIGGATAHRVAYLRLNSAWRRADRLASMRVPGRASVPQRRFALPLVRLAGWRMAASAVLLAAGGGWFAWSASAERPAAYSTVLGESRAVALADGTSVTLNTNTRLRSQIAGRKRTVWLDSGEAYFEVAHDASRPFVVEAGNSRIKVLGTKFSVRREAGQVTVAVVDGRVQVSNTGAAAVGVVTRNDTLVDEHGQMRVSHATSEQVVGQLGWREGKLNLNQMTLGQAAAEFNRYNRRKLVIADPAAAQMRIGGSFNVDNVDGFVRLLEQGFGLKAQAGKDEITIVR